MLVGIGLLAAALRSINIGTEPYWGDEILSLGIYTGFSRMGEMLRYIAEVEIHPPFYYILMKPWTAWLGMTEAATRSLSLLFGVGTVVVAFFLGRSVARSTRVGLVAALLIAVLPIQVEYGQEARPYAFFCLFATLAMLAAWEYTSSRRKCWLVLYVVSAVLGLYLHYSFLFTVVAISMWWLLNDLRPNQRRHEYLLNWLLTHAIVFLLFLPWLKPFFHKMTLGEMSIFGLTRNTGTMREPGMFDVSLGRLVWLSWTEHLPRLQILATAVFKFVFGLALLIVLAPLVGHSKKKEVSEDRRRFTFLLVLIFVPLILFIASPAALSYTERIFRHVLPVTLPLAVLFAMMVDRLSGRWGKFLLALFLVTLLPYLTFVLQNDAAWNYKHRVGEVGQIINDNYRPGDVVVASYNFGRSNISHYLEPEIPVETLVPVDYFGHDLWRSRTMLGLIENETQLRMPKITQADAHRQLSNIEQRHRPKRVWLYGISANDLLVHSWFEADDWRHGFQSIGGLILLDLYVSR